MCSNSSVYHLVCAVVRRKGSVSVVWVYCLLPPARSRRTGDCRILPERRRVFRQFGGACVKQHFPNCTGSGCFSSVCCRWDGLFCRYVCGGLKRQSETRFALLARHHKLISCPTLAPTELVYVCTVQVLFQSRRMGIAPPPISFYLYCTDVITVEKRGHSPPPPHWRSGLRLGL